jgi:hypothetical protein
MINIAALRSPSCAGHVGRPKNNSRFEHLALASLERDLKLSGAFYPLFGLVMRQPLSTCSRASAVTPCTIRLAPWCVASLLFAIRTRESIPAACAFGCFGLHHAKEQGAPNEEFGHVFFGSIGRSCTWTACGRGTFGNGVDLRQAVSCLFISAASGQTSNFRQVRQRNPLVRVLQTFRRVDLPPQNLFRRLYRESSKRRGCECTRSY